MNEYIIRYSHRAYKEDERLHVREELEKLQEERLKRADKARKASKDNGGHFRDYL